MSAHEPRSTVADPRNRPWPLLSHQPCCCHPVQNHRPALSSAEEIAATLIVAFTSGGFGDLSLVCLIGVFSHESTNAEMQKLQWMPKERQQTMTMRSLGQAAKSRPLAAVSPRSCLLVVEATSRAQHLVSPTLCTTSGAVSVPAFAQIQQRTLGGGSRQALGKANSGAFQMGSPRLSRAFIPWQRQLQPSNRCPPSISLTVRVRRTNHATTVHKLRLSWICCK